MYLLRTVFLPAGLESTNAEYNFTVTNIMILTLESNAEARVSFIMFKDFRYYVYLKLPNSFYFYTRPIGLDTVEYSVVPKLLI